MAGAGERPGDSLAVKDRVNQVPSPFQSDPVKAVWQAWECRQDGYGAGQPLNILSARRMEVHIILEEKRDKSL